MKKTLTMAAIAAGLMLSSAGAMAADAPAKTDATKPAMHHGEKHGDRFAKADKNGDGFLTKEELMKAHQERTEKMFAKLDTDKDGKLSKAEMEVGKKEMREKMKAHWQEKKGKAETAAPEKAPE